MSFLLLDVFRKQQKQGCWELNGDNKGGIGSERKEVGGCCACCADKLECCHLLLLLWHVKGLPALVAVSLMELLTLHSLLLVSGCSLLLGQCSMLSD